MQLHHITPEAEGGGDTTDNCIPLCLECHEEVGSYNPAHPIGRKFTSQELKQHRDVWFQFVRSHPERLADSSDGFFRANLSEIVPSARPYVYFDLIPTGPLIEGVLKNTGVSAAYDVTVSLQPAVQVHIRNSAQDSCLIGKPVSLMAPEKEIREFLGAYFELERSNPTLRFTGEVSYFDHERRKYSEAFVIDLSLQKDMPYIGRTTIEDELKKLNESVAEIAQALTKRTTSSE